MKLLFITLIILMSGCTKLSNEFLVADITGEKYTIYTGSGAGYKVDDYRITNGVINFSHNGSEYKASVWTVKTTKVDD